MNVGISFLLIFYTYYLVALERKSKKREQELDSFASNVIQQANEKAIHILKNSKYLSENMKREVNDHFDELVTDLKAQNEAFYTTLQHNYSNAASQVAQTFEKQASEELHTFSDEISKSAQEVKKEFQTGYKKEYEDAKAQIDAYKTQEQDRIRKELLSRMKTILPAVVAETLSSEDHEKIVDQVIEKASHDGYFASN